jgi:3'-5' exoribonuclease
MKSPYVGTLAPNEIVTGCFLVVSKDIRQKKTGEPYLSLHIGDRTGDIEAKMWDNVGEVMDTFERDDFIKVKGLVQVYQNRSQFTVHKLRRLEDHEVEFEDFFPCSERGIEEMWGELNGIIAGIGNQHLRSLLLTLFSNASLADRYKVAPAAKSIHHACRGGLLEHVLSLCTLCRIVGPHYQGIDMDLLLTGAIVHDIGKIDELTYTRSFNYSSDGQLLGHIVIGLRMVGDAVAQLPAFPAKLRTLVDHMIISHHGEVEFGSPKVPLFAEALLLHHLDNLDSKMATIKNALQRDSRIEGEFTGWIPALERSILKKERYLGGQPSALSGRSTVETINLPVEAPAATVSSPAPKPHSVEAAKPAPATAFGEKLQAVLGLTK